MNRLLLFIPVAIGLEHWLPHQHITIFAASGLRRCWCCAAWLSGRGRWTSRCRAGWC